MEPVSAVTADDRGMVGIDGVQSTAQGIDSLVQPVTPAIFVCVGPHRCDQLVSRHAAMTVDGKELHERLSPLPPPIGNLMAVDRELKGSQHKYGQKAGRVTA